MSYDKRLVAVKLRRWADYLAGHHLPAWQEIPDIGIYTEQAIGLINDYLLFLTPEQKSERFLTPSMVSCFIRRGSMPEPLNKKFYRTHIAYLIMICTLKYCFDSRSLQKHLPPDLTADKLENYYTAYADYHLAAQKRFIMQIRFIAQDILSNDPTSELYGLSMEELIAGTAITGNYIHLLAEKLMRINDYSLKGYEEASPADDAGDHDPDNIVYLHNDRD